MTKDLIFFYHTSLEKLFDCGCCSEERLDLEAAQFHSIYFTRDSYLEAKAAASSLCTLVEKVLKGDLDNGFAVIRPPGKEISSRWFAGTSVARLTNSIFLPFL